VIQIITSKDLSSTVLPFIFCFFMQSALAIERLQDRPLANPINVSCDIASKLKEYGFDVVYRQNLRIG